MAWVSSSPADLRASASSCSVLAAVTSADLSAASSASRRCFAVLTCAAVTSCAADAAGCGCSVAPQTAQGCPSTSAAAKVAGHAGQPSVEQALMIVNGPVIPVPRLHRGGRLDFQSLLELGDPMQGASSPPQLVAVQASRLCCRGRHDRGAHQVVGVIDLAGLGIDESCRARSRQRVFGVADSVEQRPHRRAPACPIQALDPPLMGRPGRVVLVDRGTRIGDAEQPSHPLAGCARMLPRRLGRLDREPLRLVGGVGASAQRPSDGRQPLLAGLGASPASSSRWVPDSPAASAAADTHEATRRAAVSRSRAAC